MTLLTKGVDVVQEIIGINFRKPQLLQQALTHSSYANEASRSMEHNERLEFLGDAVLECVVTTYLFKNYPRMMEGEMTQLRASLVNMDMLAKVAEELGLGAHLLMSRGQKFDFETNPRDRIAIQGDLMEAIIGAIYCDRNMGTAEIFCLEFLLPRLETIRRQGLFKDPKSRFQEIAQERLKKTPRYEVRRDEGPDHRKIFFVAVYVGDEVFAEGTGMSKQDAEVHAATVALKERFGIEFHEA